MGMIKLYKVENERGHFSMWGDIQNGRLSLSGSDYGKAVSGFWGGGGYEYHFSLTEDNTCKLAELLGVQDIEQDLLEAVRKKFFDPAPGGGFKEFCEENGIDPGFGSYIDFDD